MNGWCWHTELRMALSLSFIYYLLFLSLYPFILLLVLFWLIYFSKRRAQYIIYTFALEYNDLKKKAVSASKWLAAAMSYNNQVVWHKRY